MASATYDCIVIGSGPGGYVAAIRAAQLGMSTAVVEKDRVGGRCLNYACIPAKAVLRSADVVQEIREAGEFGDHRRRADVDFAKVMERRDEVVGTLTGGVGDAAEEAQGRRIRGHRRADAGAARCRSATRSSRRPRRSCSRPARSRASIPGTEFGGRVIGTEEAWALKELPAASRSSARAPRAPRSPAPTCAWARRSSCSRVSTACCRPRTPTSARSPLAASRSRASTSTPRPSSATWSRASRQVTFSYGDEQGEADWLVIATGRGPDVEGLGLDAAGVKLDEAGLIDVDGALLHERPEGLRDRRPRAGPALAHKSMEEGVIAVEHAAGLIPPHWTTRTSRARRSARRTSAASA